ncbi:phosphotransferase family protein [Rugosimonospora africana]|uniref:Aminoglycoside phosphotransferase domain-containing protein n=1 Tax=Rugosimonospora africana TaxID=556532 RepID=A0A8J3QS59_9ACTN|nr:phosphotransferase [Rugosimonospora africana]GIH15511.1 hypothetical protein Raf01_36830 [Rugosimonospora africana]
MSGLYHDNYVVARGGRTYVVRVRRHLELPDVEPRMYAETSVLAALATTAVPTPELIFGSDQPEYCVISFLPGQRVADRHPAGTPIPDSFVELIRSVMISLHDVDEQGLGTVLPASPWPQAAHDEAFVRGLLRWLTGVYESCSAGERQCLQAMGVPADVFNPRHFTLSIAGRRFRLCHGDLQRSNVLATADDRYFILDWEMALWADPVWDIASHMHRVAYPPEQEHRALQRLLGSCRDWNDSASDHKAYQTYLRLERYRSLVLDCVRNLRNGGDWDEATRVREATIYHHKLVAAGIDRLPFDEVFDLYERRWSAGR